ncbi:hypothetical protein [Chryseobacterium sp.]|uniref:hypothetical protein n=1 Tax=Chryseobacterium sp. TaxID=1871047 RepID=UPI0025BA6454|nr:hypothetical protein [Chryseobacterium sp.]
MKNIIIGILALGFLSTSCKKDERPTYLKDEGKVQQVTSVTNNSSNVSLLNQSGSTMITSAGMNPPHGQPGHRCDIPVGQPLNQAAPVVPNNNVVPNAIQIDPNTITANTSSVQKTKTAPGMNPPHGEPGHRCDIPVGQPLNSKSAPQPTTGTIQGTPAPASSEQKLAVGEKPALNPPHGEPFHDCAIKVGDPLP